MIYVRMETSHAACCMTAEMARFINWGDMDPEQFSREISRHTAEYLREHNSCHMSDYFYGKGETSEEAWKNALEELRKYVQEYSYNGVQVRYFWFVDYCTGNGYENNELRTIIAASPNVVKLGTHRNANTYNMLDGYMLVIENTNGTDGEDDDDDNW